MNDKAKKGLRFQKFIYDLSAKMNSDRKNRELTEQLRQFNSFRLPPETTTEQNGGEAGKTRNESDDLITKIKKRLDDLSQKIRPQKAVSQAVNIHRKTLVKRKVLTEAEINRGFVRSWTAVRNEARSIFNEAMGAGIKLPNVPAADGTVWSFERLQNWLDESLYEISKLQKHIPKTASDSKIGNTPVTLREFMNEYCEPLNKNLLESRIKSLQSLHQREKIKLQHVGKYKQGQSKKYLPSFLISKWPTYREILPSLPKLKQS